MALTEKGKKLKSKFRAQYGKKKGDSVFYAMENSGKLRKVIKAGGGRDARDFGKKSTTKADFSKVGPGSVYAANVAASKQDKPSTFKTTVTKSFQKAKSDLQGLFKGNMPFSALNLANNLIFTPLTKMNRTRRARGNMLIGGKKDPITREYYRTHKKPLDVMSKEGIQYQKDAGLITDPPKDNEMDTGPVLCPDGTPPPCKPTVRKPTVPKPQTPGFLKDFKAYPLKSGGVSSGPPPKRGPNPQVPPVKLKKGKMTKSYKMSCPHRPDGIRGMGAAIRGHKFVGVK
ncbi:hypothetical protein [Hyphomonas sp.]|uniref:hypothetical protein n=1 Tax=Hyphomonas sp. TaxID=87 RepID=UPI000C973C19|nr:hypothetical protein [Hyphomonas sp.]MAL45979.1 hypothetical protein [Hyphomonas sp.]